MNSIVILTYHGDETITIPFSNKTKAIEYALDELVDCTDYDREDFVVLEDKAEIQEQYTDDDSVIAVISDSPFGGDERIYTIAEYTLDPTYESKF